MKNSRYVFIYLIGLTTSKAHAQKSSNVSPPFQQGVYAIWYNQNQQILNLPYVKGGQIIVQWADIEKQEGIYDFTAIDIQLKSFLNIGKFTTIQINGNVKPAWMFNNIPYHPEKLGSQVLNPQGTLMYWHPEYIRAFSNLLRAFSDHIRRSPSLSIIAGIRMNFNAVGTEHTRIPELNRSPEQWKVPSGVKAGEEWSEQIAINYLKLIVDNYVTNFPGIGLFMRNNVDKEIIEKYTNLLLSGKLMIFHTSSEMEPRSIAQESKNSLFKQFSLPGSTTAYAEP